jgi:hypothetical protein
MDVSGRPLGDHWTVEDNDGGVGGGAATSPGPHVSAAIRCGDGAEREALAAIGRLDGGLEPLVREHALAIISAMLRGGSRAHDADDREMTLEASVDDDALRVELGSGCLDLRPATLARRFEGLPAPAVALVERLADSWGISYDGELRLWFVIAR